MRVLVAPDKFKGSLDADAVARAIARGLAATDPAIDIDVCPLSDGGEGFVRAVTHAAGGRFVTRRVTGPLPELKVDATFGVIDEGRTAVIEMASASGLSLLDAADRNPLYTTSFGTGELIRYAVEMECRKVLLGIGGSATCDAGIGCLQACGCHVILRSGEYASDTEPLCGRDLADVLMVKSHRGSRVDGVEIVVACDVTNPLHGPLGAAHVYAPQKGASPEDVETLDRTLRDFAARSRLEALAAEPGTGAAGGIGFGLRALLGAQLVPGFGVVGRAVGLADRVARADLVITGEGSLDAQSASGKVVGSVASLAARSGKPCLAIAGRVEALIDGIERAVALRDLAADDRSSFAEAAALIEAAAARLLADFGQGRR